MADLNPLKEALAQHLQWHGARLAFLSMFLVALFKVRTVNLAEIATALNPHAKVDSNYRRLQRFFADFQLDYDLMAQVTLNLIPPQEEGYALSLDRTNWKFGFTSINLLVLAVVHQGVAFPIYWSFLDKQGNSNTSERIKLIQRFITTFGVEQIHYLLADREFVGKEWVKFLSRKGIHFRIRIKKNFKVPGKRVPVPIKAIP